MKIVIGDKKPENAQAVAEIMNNAGFDAEAMEMERKYSINKENPIKRTASVMLAFVCFFVYNGCE